MAPQSAEQKTEDGTTMNFNADVSRLLDIVANALYSNKDVFLRELISNSADACDKLRYAAISDPSLTKDDSEFKILISKDTDYRHLSVTDNGIGMSKEELIDNLGTIAKSGTANLMEQLGKTQDEKDKVNLIGQFGVGFYSSFTVSNHVEVISRKAGSDDVWLWESDGRTGFEIRPATEKEKKLLPSNRGTVVRCKIDHEASEYLIDEKLKQVIQRYSDHINVPIFLGIDESDEEPVQVNTVSAIWARSKQDIKEEEYNAFYKHITHGMDDPLHTSHWKAEGKIEYNALIYIPTLRPWDLYDPSRKHAVKLYVKRVFIADDCEGLIFPWLRFLRGVVDSEDLPLNISREMLQHNPVITRIKNGIAKRVLSDIDKLSRNDDAKFASFWGQFGAVLKEGLYDAPDHREGLLKITRFFSTHENDTLTSLEDYVSRMKDDQKEIYYISGENIETLKNSPQIEGFIARGIEVLFFTDTIDDFWLQSVIDYKGLTFKSVTKGDVDLADLDADTSPDDKKEDKDDGKSKLDEKSSALVTRLKEILEDEVGDVRYSNRMTNSAVCLVASAHDVDLRMERVLKIHQQYETQSKRILEINPDHALISVMKNMQENNESIDDAAWLLLDQAKIIQGEPISNPARFAQTMSDIMTKGLEGKAKS
jgi:molecular chaperone HtpG